MALDMATPTLQGRRWLEDMPQRLGARLAVGREVIQCGDELMAFVWETVLVALRDRLHVHLLPAFSLVGIQNLNIERGPRQKQLCSKRSISENEQSFTESDLTF